MNRLVTMALTVAMLALSPAAAAPAAAAETDQIAKLILGLAAAGVIAKVISDRRDDDKNHKSEVRRDRLPRLQGAPAASGGYMHSRKLLPASCERTLAREHVRAVMPAQCLRERGIDTRSLPRACVFPALSGRKTRVDVYGLGCLKERGFEVATRGRWH